jgi:hypothetical protein
MKRTNILLVLFLFAYHFASAQTITATGTVSDPNGNPLHFAFVQDKQYKYATYTDSLGGFSLTVNPTSKLIINCYGFKDTLINIANQTNLHITLHPVANLAETNVAKGKDVDRFANESSLNSPGQQALATTQGSMFPQFSIKEQTQGNRYLFTAWVHGYVVTSADSLVQNSKYWFNYDKMGGGLLLSQDKNSAIEVNKEQVKSFTLYNNNNVPFTFEKVPTIDPSHYVEVLASGSKYKIYRTLKTKFTKADYSTNGISSTGNNFDSYEDTHEYYLLNLQNNALEKLELKKKSIKNNFANEPEKINKYISDHSSDSIDDSYLASLGSYMNE